MAFSPDLFNRVNAKCAIMTIYNYLLNIGIASVGN